MDVLQKEGLLECNYTNGCKYKAVRDNGVWGWHLYRKDWKSGNVFRIPLPDKLEEKVQNFEVNDPFNNTSTWYFLHNLWKEAKEYLKTIPYEEKKYYFGNLIRCEKKDFE